MTFDPVDHWKSVVRARKGARVTAPYVPSENSGGAQGVMAGVPYIVLWDPGVFVRITLDMQIIPAVRMTQKSKWVGNAKRYLDQQNSVRDRVILVMREHGIEAFAKDVPLKLTATVLRKVVRGDWDNYAKACGDMLQGALYEDDKQIWEGTTIKKKADLDRFTVQVEVLKEE